MKYLLTVCLIGLLWSCQKESPVTNPLQRDLYQLFDQEWAFRMQEFPTFATSCGVHTYNDRLADLSQNSIRRRVEFWNSTLVELARIDPDRLNTQDRISYDLFKYLLKDDIAQIEFEAYLIPINAEGGFYTDFAFLPREMPFDNEKDYRNYIARMEAFPLYANQQLDLMRMGIKKNIIAPKIILEGFEDFITPHLVEKAEASIFFAPFQQWPEQFTDAKKKKLTQAASQAILQKVVPAYRRILTFLKEEYIPAAREDIGISSIPRGKEYYEQRVRYFTTLPYSSKEIFEIGQAEVARIRAEMQAIIDTVGFKGSFADFLIFLRTDPQFYATSPRQLLMEAAYLSKKIDGRLPKLFNRLPRLPYGVEPVPDHIAPKYTAGRYVPGSIDNHLSGTYWVNTYKLESRPLYVLPALTLHEAVPGHHLQGSLAQELTGLPEFRKYTYLSAYGEGWGLYSEWLGQEIGIYETPYTNFGRLTYEMWRACRLVVDVGIHSKGWTRQEAVDFLASNTALSLHEVNTEIDRYIGWPGQALSYKMGELKIRELRQKAEHALGEKFDIRAFHDVILTNGAVPLFVLEDLVKTYIREND
ncbi:MAG: hypothetical protein DHS20C18_30920 [Saprospiraceae bacterium]|nr:MAG: hypothetical protein DHS20C18_30920 [Saprospiraceae bacterium]